MSITSKYYGRTKAGAEIYQYTLENANGMKVCVIEYGCIVTNVWVPDNGGVLRDVVLGYRELADYEAGTASLGSFVGRYANRIEKAQFTLNGKTYYLEPNDGANHLHGTFGRLTYQGSIVDDSLVLTGRSPDGDDGFPGNMDITVTYKLTDDNALVMDLSLIHISRCWWQQTWRPAASTCLRWMRYSTTMCPSPTSSTPTASAAQAAPGTRERPTSFMPRKSATGCGTCCATPATRRSPLRSTKTGTLCPPNFKRTMPRAGGAFLNRRRAVCWNLFAGKAPAEA